MDALDFLDSPISGFHDGVHDYLSNFFITPVEFDGITYPSSEHAYQAQKSRNNKVHHIFSTLPTPGDAKTLGRALKLDKDWDKFKDTIMLNVVFAKFNQNAEIARRLRLTGKRELIEANHWKDVYWGVCNGIGENKLGKILMQVRSQLFP